MTSLLEKDWYSYIDTEYEWLREFVRNPIETWDKALQLGDKRVEDWFLMQTYTPTLLLVVAYLVSIWLGKKLMANREAFQVKGVMFAYNVFLVILNAHIVYELVTCSWRLNYNYFCQPVTYSRHPDEMRIAAALWWYYMSKLIEFLDTIFFVLRKKNNQISFLHVYHHATMFPIWWTGIKWVAGGMSIMGAILNSFIHVIMYVYYGLTALGPHMQKYLWWKKYLTCIQLAQFVIGMCHAGQSLYFGCRFIRWMQYALIFYGMTILALFINFYYQAYVKAAKRKKEKKKLHSNGVANGTSEPHDNGVSEGSGEGKKTK